jgi:hypothetical protein
MNAEKHQAAANPTKQTTYASGGKKVLAILVLTIAAGLFLRGRFRLSPSDSPWPADSHAWTLPLYWTAADIPSSPNAGVRRPVYAYSVIPGGVVSAKELVSALQRDAVAAAHYSDFRAQSAQVVRLPSARQVYVSYRVGNHVYWTSKKLTLAAGETVLSDGTHMARTRCGNRISEVPGPSSPAEPPKEALNTPVFRYPADGPTDTPPAAPIWSDTTTPFLLALNGPAITGPRSNSPFVPPIPISPCCGVPAGPSGSSPGPGASPLPQPPPTGTPPVSTPEPQSILLLALGLSVLLVVSLFRRA